MNNHSKLVNDVLLTVGSLDFCRVWKQHVGVFQIPNSELSVKIGVKGQSDIGGVLSLDGRGIYLAIECKTGVGVQTNHQKKYQTMVEKFGGIYFVARSTEEALSKVKAYKKYEIRKS